MSKARLMNLPADYEKVGVKKDEIEMWEDGRRSPVNSNCWEWWYFDARLEDGSQAVIQFFTKGASAVGSNKDQPKFKIKITTADGKEYSQDRDFKPSEVSYGYKSCDLNYGQNYFKGNLKDYEIYLAPEKGLGANLKLHSLSKPYRPGSAYIEFGEPDHFYTWFCVVPKGEVSGTLTINGKEISVHGYGYHDHQWGNISIIKDWNHWVWSRQSYDDYSILVFDMVSSKNTEYTRFPIVFIQDKDGNVVYESNDNVICDIKEEYYDDISEKTYPKVIHYEFKNGNDSVEYELKVENIIESYGKNVLSKAQKLLFKTMGLQSSYARYDGNGTLKLTKDGQIIERDGKLIYEFMYPGTDYIEHI